MNEDQKIISGDNNADLSQTNNVPQNKIYTALHTIKSKLGSFFTNISSSMDVLVLLCFVTTPFVVIPFFYDKIDFAKILTLSSLLFIVLILSGIYLMRVKDISIKLSHITPVLLLWIAIYVTNSFFSLNSQATLVGFSDNRAGSFLALILLAFLFNIFINKESPLFSRVISIFKYLLSASVIFSIFQALNLFGSGLLLGDFVTIFGGLTYASLMGLVLLVISTVDLFSANDSIGRPNRIFNIISIVASLVLTVLVGWWALSVAAAIAFIVVSLLANKFKFLDKKFIVSSVLVVVFLLVVNYSQIYLKFRADTPIELMPSVGSMLEISKSSLQRFPMGVGFENFIYAYDYFRPGFVTNSQFHNLRFIDGGSEIFNKVIEGGIPALVAILFSLVWLIVVFSRQYKNGLNKTRIYGWSIVFIVLLSSFFYPLNVSLLVAFIFGISLVSIGDDWKVINLSLSGYNKSFLSSLLGIIVIVGGVFGLYGVYAYGYSNFLILKALQSNSAELAIEKIVSSISINNEDRSLRALIEAVLVKISKDVRSGPIDNESKDQFLIRIRSQVNSLTTIVQRLVELQPNDSQNWFIGGYVYQNLAEIIPGADQLAVQYFSEALARNPSSPVTYYRIGNTMLESAERNLDIIKNDKTLSADRSRQIQESIVAAFSAAENSYKQAILLYNNYGDALYNLSATYERQGKLKEAIASFELLAKNDPQNPSILLQLGLLYYRNNQKDAAFMSWDTAVKISPTYSNARWYLSLILEERGQLDKALEQVIEIEKFNKDSELVKQRIKQLNDGRRIIPPGNLLDQKPL